MNENISNNNNELQTKCLFHVFIWFTKSRNDNVIEMT
jgi:hypothetical protein